MANNKVKEKEPELPEVENMTLRELMFKRLERLHPSATLCEAQQVGDGVVMITLTLQEGETWPTV